MAVSAGYYPKWEQIKLSPLVTKIRCLCAELCEGSKNSIWPVTSQVLSSAANFAITVFVIRAIGIAQFGQFSIYYLIALNLSAVILALVMMPLSSILELTEKSEQRALIATSSWVFCTISLVTVAFLIGGGFLFGLGANSAILALFFMSIALTEFLRRILFLVCRDVQAFLSDVLRYICVGLAFLFVVNSPIKLDPTICVLIISTCFLAGSILTFCQNFAKTIFVTSANQMQKNIGRIVKSGGWLSWATFLQFCNEHLFVAVGALVLGPQTIGMVRASQSLVGLINPFLYALENILPRKIGADMRALGQERAVASYRRFAVAIVFCLGLPLLGIAFFAEPISNLFLGQRVFEVWILQAFCGVYFLIVLRTLITFALRAFECTKAISNATALAALTSAIIAYPAMMFFNVSGLVGGITIAQLIATLALIWPFSLVIRERTPSAQTQS